MAIKILIYSVNFYPELIGVGKYSGEMGAWLAAHDCEIRVVAAPPYYPDWLVRVGYSGSIYQRETLNGMQIWRCPIWIPKRPGGVKRLLHLGSFALTSIPVMLRQIFWKPDLVWVVEPALICAPTAWITARSCGGKVWLHVQDFEVDAAFDLGLLQGRILRKLATLEKMEQRVKFDLHYIRNWSIVLDLKIVCLTVVKGFINKNAY